MPDQDRHAPEGLRSAEEDDGVLAPTEPAADAPLDDDAIRVIVKRLARRHPSGGTVVERAAILAEGVDSGAIVSWVIAHGGEAEERPAAAPQGGLHSARRGVTESSSAPRRYVLPPEALL